MIVMSYFILDIIYYERDKKTPHSIGTKIRTNSGQKYRPPAQKQEIVIRTIILINLQGVSK